MPDKPNRALIHEASGHNATKQVSQLIEMLETSYLQTFKKKLPVDLFVSVCGERNNPIIGITAYFDDKNREEVEYLKSVITEKVR
jgi:hypothetical protein